MLDEQRATKSCGAGTSVNKEYWNSKAASNSPVYSLRVISAYDELQIVVTEVGQVRQTVTMQKTRRLDYHINSKSAFCSLTLRPLRLTRRLSLQCGTKQNS